MPILNAFSSVWDLARISVPMSPSHDTSGTDLRMVWPTAETFMVTNFSIKEVSTLDFDTSVAKGSPTGSMWSVGDTVWQIDFSIPFLVWNPTYFAANGISFSSFQVPAFANMPVVSGCAYPTQQFVTAAKQFLLGSERQNRSLWLEHWAGSSNPDFIVQRASIQISDTGSALSVSLLSTTDPRLYFNVIQVPMTFSPGPLRIARPWDFSIPNDVQVLGSPITAYYGGYSTAFLPERRVRASYPMNISLVLEWSIGIESQVTRFRSSGTPSGRPMMGVTSQQCSGRLRYIPLHVEDYTSYLTASIVDPNDPSASLPTGWRTDSQSMEAIERHGGQLFVSGHPNYQVDGHRPVFPEIGLKYGANMLSYYIAKREMFGPVGAASVGFEAAAGGSNAVVVDYKTLLGNTDAEAEFFSSLTGS